MEREIVYMLGIVAAGFVVNFTLRALPFILFAGKRRELPPWVEGFGNVVSPIIISALIVYSYSGLEWRTAWPYLAGVFTLGLQIWRRNALLSILVGTAVYMLCVAGCTTVREVKYGVDHPILELSETGLKFDGGYVKPEDVPGLLEEYQIPKDAVIHIAITPAVQKDLKPVRTFMGFLSLKGYRRTVLVTGLHGESAVRKERVRAPAAEKSGPKIRYKGANE